ncbi:microtubule-associated protein 10 [Sinocyclocheilus rhinocerous]|uniref:microtubule-associated protein 10 n=1 Tax=Sinocyclocheilus rhinocerous TaxID=307959 RepID=UPI0007B94DC1|nr:PREDICTED: microtubule-associated protein 10-like [Sinocyclocheilus rhinocerous]
MKALCFTLTPKNMSSTQETLFSLELLIDFVRFDGSRDNVLDPAVAVRFLDFPTLLIYQSKQEDRPSKSGYADLCLSPEAISQPDDGEHLKYSFHKGKSCLFKINLHSLHAHLMNTPLYAMVLDAKDEIPKLIGSSLISLAKVTEKIKLDVEKHGIGNPSAYGERLTTPICNLMGNSIGVISLAYKIVSLGAHLIPHMPENRVYEVGVTRGKGGQDPSVHARCPERDEMPPKVRENHSVNVLLQQISLDGQSADIVISEAKQPGVPAFTQTETTEKKQRISWSEDAQEYTTFCPPPLVYSSSVKNRQERKSFTGLLAAMESLNIEDLEDGNNEVESSDMRDFAEIKADGSIKLTSTPRTQHKETDSAPFGDVIRQLPLLNALLVELSQLNIQTAQQQPLSVHPNLACLYTSAQVPSEAKPKAENQNPKQRLDQCKMKALKSATGAKRNKAKLQPKKTLKYGLTNTFRLRLKLVKQGTKRHECIEYQNAKRDQPSSSNHKRVRKAVSRGVRLDETVETLISSFDMHPTPIQTPSKSQTRPRIGKHITNAPNEESHLTEKDKKAQVHIPSQDSDRSDQHSASSIHDSNLSFQRGDSRASSNGLSNGFYGQEEYQDDFTSLNTTEGYSPDPFSSPEPSRRKRNSGSSTSSSSHPSKGLPVPAKAENSPQRAFKNTHVIRPRLQASALSLSSDEDEFESGGHRPGSQSTGQKTPSVRRTFGKSESFDSDPGDKGMTFSRVSEDSDLAANDPVLKSISSSEHDEERGELGSLGLDKNYHHISELVISKLPGYTL